MLYQKILCSYGAIPTKLLVAVKVSGAMYMGGSNGIYLFVDSVCGSEGIGGYGTYMGSSMVVALRYVIE